MTSSPSKKKKTKPLTIGEKDHTKPYRVMKLWDGWHFVKDFFMKSEAQAYIQEQKAPEVYLVVTVIPVTVKVPDED